MTNSELAKILYEIANFLEADRVAFKPLAYRKAALALEATEEGVAGIYQSGGRKALEEIPGVGNSIARKIEEYIKTGRMKYRDQLRRRLPVDLAEIIAVEGVGPKKARALYQKLGIKNLDGLQAAAKQHKIALLSGFGDKTEQNILEGIAFVKRSQGRFLLGEILPRARQIQTLIKSFGSTLTVETAGSMRRRKETIGDVDFLAILAPKAGVNAARHLMDKFTAIDGVEKIWGKGVTKASVRLREGFDMDLRILPQRSYGAALQYFTGSKEHNIALRRIAIGKGLKLSEYGLFKGSRMLPGATEEQIYRRLGLEWIPPEIRENEGEIQAAMANKLPKLIGYNDLKGDLHCHSSYSDGIGSIEEMAQAAQSLGYEYIGIADHTKFLRVANGLGEKEIKIRNKEIDKLNDQFSRQGVNFKILKGCEANILDDGSIDLSDQVLSRLDFVIAGVHSNFKLGREAMTRRLVRAMENRHVDIISHPTGRKLKKREAAPLDLEKIFKTARNTGTILEINSQPIRLDLCDQNVRRALDFGLKFAINADAHSVEHLRFAEYGLAQARRGWATARDIINAWPLKKMLSFLKH